MTIRSYFIRCKNRRFSSNGLQYQGFPFLQLMKVVGRIIVPLSGRIVNRLWKNMSQERKVQVIDKIKSKSKLIGVIMTATMGCGMVAYYTHIEESPITGRRRFMALSTEDLNGILSKVYIDHLNSIDTFDRRHPAYISVERIVTSIATNNNRRFPSLRRSWRLIIVDDDSVVNAACFPDGTVLVYTGLINFAENQQQIATVIAHEMAHVLLEHGREEISRSLIISFLSFTVGFVVLTVLPGDVLAIISNWFKNQISEVFVKLPYSRMLEIEADVLGLELVSRACFDFREAQRFWEIMDIYEKSESTTLPEWLSTHPQSSHRAQLLQTLMTKAQRISEESGCQSKDFVSVNDYRRLQLLLIKKQN